MPKLNGKAFELVSGLAELGAEMEMKFSSFEVSDSAIDLVNDASCFIQQQDEDIELLRQSLEQSKSANKRIKKEARYYDYQKLQSKHYKALEENKRLREALSYYADREHYEPYGMASKSDFGSDITEDEGEIARQALGGDTKCHTK